MVDLLIRWPGGRRGTADRFLRVARFCRYTISIKVTPTDKQLCGNLCLFVFFNDLNIDHESLSRRQRGSHAPVRSTRWSRCALYVRRRWEAPTVSIHYRITSDNTSGSIIRVFLDGYSFNLEGVQLIVSVTHLTGATTNHCGGECSEAGVLHRAERRRTAAVGKGPPLEGHDQWLDGIAHRTHMKS